MKDLKETLDGLQLQLPDGQQQDSSEVCNYESIMHQECKACQKR